jgi:hypothetical protein
MGKLGMAALALAMYCTIAGSVAAQHTTVGVPFQTNSNNYFEQVGVNFGFHTGNFFFQQNSFGLASPQFGGATPGAGATTSFALPIRGGEADFSITASQGSRSSLVSQTPSATLSNGVQGGFFDTTQTPFVAGLAPPGDMSPALERWQQLQSAASSSQRPSAVLPRRSASAESVASAEGSKRQPFTARLASAQSSSTASATLSVAELREMRAHQFQTAHQALEREAVALVERGREAEQAGKLSVARLYYEQAARRSSGLQRDGLLSHARELVEATATKKTPRNSGSAEQ